jgi:hypothetical protein
MFRSCHAQSAKARPDGARTLCERPPAQLVLSVPNRWKPATHKTWDCSAVWAPHNVAPGNPEFMPGGVRSALIESIPGSQ